MYDEVTKQTGKGEGTMKVKIELSREYTPPYAIIYTDTVDEDIQRAVDLLSSRESPVIARQEDRIIVLKPEDIWLIRVEDGETFIYTQKKKYTSKKRLYELLERLGKNFMRISKQCIVNLSYIQSVEAGFSGTLLLKLENGLSDYVSRKYLPDFKNYLGM